MHFQGGSIYKAIIQEVLTTHGMQAAMDKCNGKCDMKPLLVLGGYSAGDEDFRNSHMSILPYKWLKQYSFRRKMCRKQMFEWKMLTSDKLPSDKSMLVVAQYRCSWHNATY
eukprot:4060437-Pyramimonas_sp.AAC.3